MGPEQTLGPHCLQQRLLKHFIRGEKQTTFVAIGALRVSIMLTIKGKNGKLNLLIHDVSENDKTPCIKIDQPLVDYTFSNVVL